MHYSCYHGVSVSSSFAHSIFTFIVCIVIAACIDRWALCSNNPALRAFSRPHNAFRVILILLVVWAIIPIHLAIFFNNSTGHCIAMPESYALFYAIYSLIVIGVLPLALMITFSLLAWHNLRLIRSRVGPVDSTTRNITIHKRDRDLMKMLSGEVFAYCITTIPYPINLIYSVSTISIAAYKSPTRLAMESLIGYIVSPLLNFMYCCVQFYGKKNTFLRMVTHSLCYSVCFLFSKISKRIHQFISSINNKYQRQCTNSSTHHTSINTTLINIFSNHY